MSDQCYQPREFDHLLDLAEGHEDLRHLQGCVACRTELQLYRSFVSRDAAPEGADLADAHERLEAFLEREIGGGDEPVEPHRQRTDRIAWWRRDLRRWSPALVAASIVCVAVVLNYGNRDSGIDSPSGVVRDIPADGPALESSVSATEDGLILSWTGPAETDLYQLVVMDASMVELDRLEVDLSGHYRFDRGEHPLLQDSGLLFWYVVALRGGDEIARSGVRELEPGP